MPRSKPILAHHGRSHRKARPDAPARLNIPAMPNPVFSSLPTSIFQHMTVLALKHDAINLGQGFPDQDGPLALRQVAAKQLIDGPNQYPPSKGLLPCARRSAAHGAPILRAGLRPRSMSG